MGNYASTGNYIPAVYNISSNSICYHIAVRFNGSQIYYIPVLRNFSFHVTVCINRININNASGPHQSGNIAAGSHISVIQNETVSCFRNNPVACFHRTGVADYTILCGRFYFPTGFYRAGIGYIAIFLNGRRNVSAGIYNIIAASVVQHAR